MQLARRFIPPQFVSSRTAIWVGLIGAIVSLVWLPAFSLGLWIDDYQFMERAGRPSFLEILAQPLERLVVAYDFRPLRGVEWIVEYAWFGRDPTGYHLVQVLIHVVNCILLFWLLRKITRNNRTALLASLIYGTLPVYSMAVFWLSSPDPLATCLYLSALIAWWNYLEAKCWQWAGLTYLFFALSLLSKEIGVTLPIALFLLDVLIHRSGFSARTLVRRYLGFVMILAPYLVIQWVIQRYLGFYPNVVGYSFGGHIWNNLVEYLAILSFPWGLPEPLNYAWLALGVLFYLGIAIVKRSRELAFLGAVTLLTFVAVLPFPYTTTRWLYFPLMATGVWLALLFESAWRRFARVPVYRYLSFAGIALLLVGQGISITASATTFSELIREHRLPFHDVAVQHRDFPPGSLIYWIDQPTWTNFISGMFFQKYGSNVSVKSTEFAVPARLREASSAWIIYTDEHGRQKEQAVAREAEVQSVPELPVRFSVPINLEGYEIASQSLKQGEAVVLLLYWRATGAIDKDYTVFAHLVNARGEIVAGYDSAPRGGKLPTSMWKSNDLVVDWVIIPITQDIPAGNAYHLEIGMYYLTTMERLSIIDPRSQSITDHMVVGPLTVGE